MISGSTMRCVEETLTTEDESTEGINYLKTQISKLSIENEQYRQDLHELNRKLEISRNMEADLTEYHKVLEQSLERQKLESRRKIHEMEETQLRLEKELQDKLAESEAKLTTKIEENRALCEIIKTNEEKLLALDQTQYSTTFVDNSDELKSQIEELTELLTQEADAKKQREEMIQAMEKESTALREILVATKEQLADKNKVAESMREELFECRMELETLKAAPATDKSKGNSLFAEVEDRRKLTLGQMNAMRSSYQEAKRSFKAKEAEIKSLKAERSLLLRKWEDDTVEKIQQDASLVEKYRARIGDLETRLKEEQKKNKQNSKGQQLQENNFTYLQSLVDAKSKEIEELNTKIENDSIKALLDEEHKHKMGKQLRYWRYRAMSSEAEMISIKDRLESEPESSNAEILEVIKKRLSEKTNESYEMFENESTVRECTIVNETVVNLDTLMTIPKKATWPKDPRNSIFCTIDHSHDETLLMDETIVAEAPIITPKLEPQEFPSPDLSQIDETAKNLISSNNDRTSFIEETETYDHSQPFESLQTELESGFQRLDDSMELEETLNINKQSTFTAKIENHEESLNSNNTITEPLLKSILSKASVNANSTFLGKEKIEKDKPKVNFAPETVDPPAKTLKKNPSAPKYPIIFISSNKSKK